ncbi:hypothetical protein FKM82_029468 [Ascaphus truei]
MPPFVTYDTKLACDLYTGQGLILTLTSTPTLHIRRCLSNGQYLLYRINIQPASCLTLHPHKGPSDELYLPSICPNTSPPRTAHK